MPGRPCAVQSPRREPRPGHGRRRAGVGRVGHVAVDVGVLLLLRDGEGDRRPLRDAAPWEPPTPRLR